MKRWISLGLVLAACLLGACHKQEKPAAGEATYQIYYLNPGGTRLAAQPYYTDTTDTDALIQELMEQFVTVPPDVDSQSALTERVTYLDYKQEEMVLYLYFDNNYVAMKAEREILCRAALAKTLTQIPEIDYISVYSGDQPLLDTKGKPTGMISTGDIIEKISDVNTFEKTELTLYFTDEEGAYLTSERREVIHSINTSKERLVVDELLKGPEQDDLLPTLDSEIKVLNVSVMENVCYINFDSTFLSHNLEVKDYIPIYSIVNSLMELSTVSRVQITVNGSADVKYRDSISLNTLFERNLDYIQGGEPN